jgi:hypothetical protein
MLTAISSASRTNLRPTTCTRSPVRIYSTRGLPWMRSDSQGGTPARQKRRFSLLDSGDIITSMTTIDV